MRLKEDTRNYRTALSKELAWKRGNLKAKHWYLQNLLSAAPEIERAIPTLIREFVDAHPRPSILDVGCGPISCWAWLHYQDLADLRGIDVLADRYAHLLEELGYRKADHPMLTTPAENMDLAFQQHGWPSEYDIVHCRNALDHCRLPALVWWKMYEATKVGGLIYQSHSLNEADKEGHRQLHQFNIKWIEDRLIIVDAMGYPAYLSRLPLELVKATTDGGWIITCHRKLADLPMPYDYLFEMNAQIQNAYLNLTQWIDELEAFVNEHE